jgi:hypothetical protein
MRCIDQHARPSFDRVATVRLSSQLFGKLTLTLALVLPRAALANCTATSPCVDAEPLWLPPQPGRLLYVSDAAPTAAGTASLSLAVLFRLRPAVLTVPAPNQSGRDVNVLRHATDASLGGSFGIGDRLELTWVLPAGLYQRGAGIKGVTHQSADPIAPTTLHDPRLGFGYALPWRSRALSAKLRFEAKLPLGNEAALSGEPSAVASPSLALSASHGGFFSGLELGPRLRRPSSVFGVRVGSQLLIAGGAGYELKKPRLAFALQAYLLPSLVDSGSPRYLPAEWLASVRFAPGSFAFGVAGGGGLPFSGDAGGSSLAFGVPSFRAALFAQYVPQRSDAHSHGYVPQGEVDRRARR